MLGRGAENDGRGREDPGECGGRAAAASGAARDSTKTTPADKRTGEVFIPLSLGWCCVLSAVAVSLSSA